MSSEKPRPKTPTDAGQAARDLKQQKDLKSHKRDTVDALIRQQVLHSLGAPDGLVMVQVRPLWAEHYRVNVFLGTGIGSAEIAHSFFLSVDGDANIMTCSPEITRHY